MFFSSKLKENHGVGWETARAVKGEVSFGWLCVSTSFCWGGAEGKACAVASGAEMVGRGVGTNAVG